MTGQAAIVTGAARGFGLAISNQLMECGVRVIGWDQDPSPIEADDRFLRVEKIDILINNAGIHGLQVPVEDHPLENWQRVIAVDLTAVFVCTQAIVPHMKQAGYGRIVTIASQADKEGLANISAYNAAKADVIGLMKGLSKELASFGITANCITPSLVETDLISEIKAKKLMGRLCEVSEVTDMVAWIASPACPYSTGACFDVSGGRAQF
jgi:3-oxoacyl-[acyl-carrier protein] reductase